MSYAIRLPRRQNLLVPAVAAALGFAGATGAYVALDDGFLSDDSNSSSPAAAVTAPRGGVSSTGVNEASTAAAVSNAAKQTSITTGGANEASTAAAVGGSSARPTGGANEASTAAAVGRSGDTAQFLAERGIVLRRSAAPSPGGSRP
jgi:hypothetical protein